jgi:hypothetical protein
MGNNWSNEIEAILSEGRSLTDVGVRNWGFTQTAALAVIARFASIGVPILGGDVYEIIDGILQSNYDNWYCDPLAGETEADFLKRSLDKAESYISSYYAKEPDKVFFVLVPKN